MNPPVIKTQFTYPPIPVRAYDWMAWVDGQEEGPVGHGETEAEAVANLREQLDRDRADSLRKKCYVAERDANAKSRIPDTKSLDD